jgi:uncharacterized protein YbdZ (MbtH family)
MANPFDDDNAAFLVAVNAAGQHALWPAATPVPGGWTAAHGPDSRSACLEHVSAHWTGPARTLATEPDGGVPA